MKKAVRRKIKNQLIKFTNQNPRSKMTLIRMFQTMNLLRNQCLNKKVEMKLKMNQVKMKSRKQRLMFGSRPLKDRRQNARAIVIKLEARQYWSVRKRLDRFSIKYQKVTSIRCLKSLASYLRRDSKLRPDLLIAKRMEIFSFHSSPVSNNR